MNWDLYLNFLIAMMAISNPIGKIPIWTELTSDKDNAVRKRLAFLVAATSLILLLIFLLTGKELLKFFKIDLAAFQIGGGILLLLTSISMVSGKAVHLEHREEKGDTAYEVAKKRFRRVVVPLVVPIMAGPGSITTVIIYGLKTEKLIQLAGLSIVLFTAIFLTYLVFLSAKYFENKVDKIVFTIITRLFGVLLAAIAVQFMIEGIAEVFPALIDSSSVVNDNLQNNN